MLARLHVIISSEENSQVDQIKEKLKQINPKFSISPVRSYPGLKDHSELYCTLEIEKNDVETLLAKLNNDWDGEFDDCDAYGFNTIMFHPHVYGGLYQENGYDNYYRIGYICPHCRPPWRHYPYFYGCCLSAPHFVSVGAPYLECVFAGWNICK